MAEQRSMETKKFYGFDKCAQELASLSKEEINSAVEDLFLYGIAPESCPLVDRDGFLDYDYFAEVYDQLAENAPYTQGYIETAIVGMIRKLDKEAEGQKLTSLNDLISACGQLGIDDSYNILVDMAASGRYLGKETPSEVHIQKTLLRTIGSLGRMNNKLESTCLKGVQQTKYPDVFILSYHILGRSNPEHFKKYFDKFMDVILRMPDLVLPSNIAHLYQDNSILAAKLLDSWMSKNHDPKQIELVQQAIGEAQSYLSSKE